MAAHLPIIIVPEDACDRSEAFRAAALYYPQAAKTWLNCLAGVSPDDTLALFQQIPPDRISDLAIEFAQKILEFNQHRLLDLGNKL